MNSTKRFIFALTTLIFSILLSFDVFAEMTLEIDGGGAQQIAIALVPFESGNKASSDQDTLTDIIGADLTRSGLFKNLETRGLDTRPHEASEVKYSDWAAINAQALVIGNVQNLSGNQLQVTFRLLDVLKQTELLAMEFKVANSQRRMAAHQIADLIYQKLTGDQPAFASRIAYVNKTNKSYTLNVADSDGYNPQEIVTSKEPIISPSWSFDGSRLAYVSFEMKKPVIFIQSLISGKRYVLANFKGNNSAPAWSPDGKKLAIVLTYSDNSQIYIINSDGTGLKQLTSSNAIDTEPAWSADGNLIYFTSNRGGGPQIYSISLNSNEIKRVTFERNYNVSPKVSYNGKLLTFITQDSSGFRVCAQNLADSQINILSKTNDDESPSFSPNGRMILYASNIDAKGTLKTISIDGTATQNLINSSGDLRDPAWGPMIK